MIINYYEHEDKGVGTFIKSKEHTNKQYSFYCSR